MKHTLLTEPDALPDPALATLRAATHTRHQRIDRQLDLARMGDPAHYARVLQVLDAFLGPWEAAAAAALPATFRGWFRQRSRHRFLQADLLALGLPSLAGPTSVPALSGPAAAWGSLYVMEGSALGGQVITRALAAQGMDAANGGAYFRGWGPATGAMWREFRGLLAEQLPGPQDIAAACSGAQATFDALSVAFESHLHERPAPA
ncbi:MAG: biliverdin-producing heme oxygenase [Ramlibacter sp.]